MVIASLTKYEEDEDVKKVNLKTYIYLFLIQGQGTKRRRMLKFPSTH